MIWKALAWARYRGIEKNIRFPRVSQEAVLRKILQQLNGCKLAKELSLDHINSVETFRRVVPITQYSFYKNYISHILAGEDSVLFKGKPVCFAKSGGTTKEPKLIPLSRSLLRSYRQFNLDMAFCYMWESGNFDVFADKIFLVVANPTASLTRKEVPIGHATGIMAKIAPKILQRRFVPDMAVIQNLRTDEKIRQTNQQAYNQRSRISFSAGLTPYLLSAWNNLIQFVYEKEGIHRKISEIFPSLKVAFHGGSSYNLYLERMQELSGEQVDHRNVYSAAEGPIAFQWSRSSSGLIPALDGVFFEFLPDDPKKKNDQNTFLVDEVECGVPYYILLTTQGGLLRYKIGDRVEFIHKDPPLFKVLGRTEDLIDLSGEKLGANQALVALKQTGQSQGVRLLDFIVCPSSRSFQDSITGHEWIIECESPPKDVALFRENLEKSLFLNNKRYMELRVNNFSLSTPDITFVPKGTFQRFIESNFNYGQQKMLHMHRDRLSVEKLLNYANNKQFSR